jgi:hypothetical protein
MPSAYRLNPSDHIGNGTRDKYTAFLSRNYELGYLSTEDFTQRMEAVAVAVTLADAQKARVNLAGWDDWSEQWGNARDTSLRVQTLVTLPDVRQSRPRVSLLAMMSLVIAVAEMTVIIVLMLVH